MSSDFTKRIVDFFAPVCDVSGKRYVVGANKASEFRQLLKENGISEPKFANIESLSPGSFEHLVQVKCDLSGTQFDLRCNQAAMLAANYRKHGNSDRKILSAKLVSPDAYQILILSRCGKTGEAFYSRENCYGRYESEFLPILRPRHPDCKLPSRDLSPRGFEIIKHAADEILERLKNWVGSERGPSLRRHRIVSTLGRVSTNLEHDSPEKVESYLRLQAVQIGGNALVNYEWEIHKNEYSEKYIAGYGKNGNPYYKTRWHHEKWFTGEATVVLAQPPGEQRRHAAGFSNQQGRGDEHFAAVLGVSPEAIPDEMRIAHQLLYSMFRPKAEILTKEDEENLSKFVEINEAFNYFRVKNEF